MTIRSSPWALTAVVIVFLLAGCQPAASNNPAAAIPESTAAADYRTQSGGAVETRYPFYGAGGSNPLQLAGSLPVCIYRLRSITDLRGVGYPLYRSTHTRRAGISGQSAHAAE